MTRRRLMCAVPLAAAPSLLVGCVEPPPRTVATPGPDRSSRTTAAAPNSIPATTTPPTEPETAMDPDSNLRSLTDDLTELEGRLRGRLGVAVAPLDATASVIGSVETAVAWSTIKVPLTMAALQAHPSATTRDLASRAIRDSDNAAAAELWQGWPDPVRAAAAVEAVLTAAGDDRTRVVASPPRSGYSAYGQTEWPLAAQAEFAARLECLRSGNDVGQLMRRVADNQRWGYADPTITSAEAAVKGGWGPDPEGGYLVRQLAIVDPDAGSPFGVALAARPRSGRFRDGADALTAVARWTLDRLRVTGPARCADR